MRKSSNICVMFERVADGVIAVQGQIANGLSRANRKRLISFYMFYVLEINIDR